MLVLALVAVTLWIQAATPVLSEESYYWLYGEHLDWSYFDHPGMVGWTIRLGTRLLGQNALGLRAMALVTALGTTWAGLRWVRALGGDGSSELLWLALTLGIPLLAAGHLVATPDGPLTLFYVLAARELCKLATSPSRARFALAGALIGLAMLSKYTAAFLVPGLALQLLLDPGLRRRVRLTDLALMGATALLVFTPVLYWNLEHGWVSLLFQTEGRYSSTHLSLLRPLEFAASQLLLVSPLLLWAGLRSGAWAVRRARAGDGRFLALLAYGLPLPLFLTANAVIVAPKVHWAIPAYVPLAILAVLWWQHEGRARAGAVARRVGLAWIALSWLVCLANPAMRWLPQPGGTHWDPDGIVAQRALSAAVALNGEGPGRTFLFTVSHRDSAELVWAQRAHLDRGHPPVPVLAQNVRGRPAKQFDVWTDAGEYVGWDAILALDGLDEREGKVESARRHFDSVELVDTVELTFLGAVLRRVRLYACRDYAGPAPAAP